MYPADGNTMAFSGIGVSNGTPLSYFITSARPAGIPRVQAIEAYSDKATALLKFYYTTNSSSVTNPATVAAGTNTVWGPQFTNFAANDIIVIQYKGSNSAGLFDFYERNKVSGTPTASNCVLTWVSQYPLNYGDSVYKMVSGATLPMFGLTNSSKTASTLYFGQEAKPMLIELDATTSGSIYSVSGEFWRRPRP